MDALRHDFKKFTLFSAEFPQFSQLDWVLELVSASKKTPDN